MSAMATDARDRYENRRTSNRLQQRAAVRRERNLSFSVYEKLRSAIRSGMVGDGVRLREDELSETFSAGRAAVRSALAHLVQDGLIERGRRRGTMVSEFAGRVQFESGVEHVITDHVLDGSSVDRGEAAMQRRTMATGICTVDTVVTALFEGERQVHVSEYVVEIGLRPVEFVTEYRKLCSERMKSVQSRALYSGFLGAEPTGEGVEVPAEGRRRDVRVYATLADPDLAKILAVDEGSAVLVEESSVRNCAGALLELTVTRRPGAFSRSFATCGRDRNSLPSRIIG